MRLQLPLILATLGAAWLLERIRSRPERGPRPVPATPQDAGSRRVLTLTQAPAVLAGLAVAYLVPSLDLPPPWRPLALAAGLSTVAVGAALRWWAVRSLGRFFVATVAIQPGHQVIRAGPYRVLRHPSYAGGSLLLAGLGLATANLGALLICALVPLAGFAYRIRVEESALRAALPDYAAYARGTSRLVPFIW